MAANLLTARKVRVHHVLKPHASGASHRDKAMARIDQACRKTVPQGVLKTPFLLHGTLSLVGRAGFSLGQPIENAGSLFRSLVGPHGSPPVHDQSTGGDCMPQSTEEITMAKANPEAELRPKTTQSHTIKAAEKRIRRSLSKRGFYLKVSSTDRGINLFGRYAVFDHLGRPLKTHFSRLEEIELAIQSGSLMGRPEDAYDA